MKQEYTRPTSTVKYEKYLPIIKMEIDSQDLKSINAIFKGYGISNSWVTFLKKSNVIYKDSNDFYRWSEKIPVSKKLIEAFRNYKFETNQEYRLKIKPIETNLFTEIKKDPIKRIRKQKVESEKTGLIRRFIKWIY
jgi:competence CoiA-like predicted nuclease